MAFVARALSFVFQRTDGSTFSNGSNTITLPPGLQASARILFAGYPAANHAQVTIWGLTPSILADLNTLNIIYNLQPHNVLTIMAGEANGNNFGTVFKGGIRSAVPDLNRQPESPLVVDAYTGIEYATVPALPQSFTGASDINIMLKGLANQMNYGFEPNGVTGVLLSNQYLWGSPIDMVRKIHDAVINRGVTVDTINNVIVVYYTQKGRGGVVPLVTPQNGLIGYPSYTNFGINFRCIYNPLLSSGRGAQVQVQSTLIGAGASIPANPEQGTPPPISATGLWNIYGLAHSLDSQIPQGLWETSVQASRVGYPTPAIPQPQ